MEDHIARKHKSDLAMEATLNLFFAGCQHNPQPSISPAVIDDIILPGNVLGDLATDKQNVQTLHIGSGSEHAKLARTNAGADVAYNSERDGQASSFQLHSIFTPLSQLVTVLTL